MIPLSIAPLAQGSPADRYLMGGRATPTPLPEDVRAALAALADTLVPPAGAFPEPSRAGVVEFVARYVEPDGREARLFPYLTVSGLAELLAPLGPDVADVPAAERERRVAALEAAQPAAFGVLRTLIYHGFYTSPGVLDALAGLPGGRDLRPTPQPLGYLDTIEDWPEDFVPPTDRGWYRRTEDVAAIAVPDAVRELVRFAEEAP